MCSCTACGGWSMTRPLPTRDTTGHRPAARLPVPLPAKPPLRPADLAPRRVADARPFRRRRRDGRRPVLGHHPGNGRAWLPACRRRVLPPPTIVVHARGGRGLALVAAIREHAGPTALAGSRRQRLAGGPELDHRQNLRGTEG